MRPRLWLAIMILICLVASGALAEESQKSKRIRDVGNREKTEESPSRMKGKQPESLGTKPPAKKSTPASGKKSETRFKATKTKVAAPKKADDSKKKEKGLLPSLKKLFNGANDYFIDKNGDGVSDWWEKKKRIKVQPKPTYKRRTTESNDKREKKSRRR